MKKRIIVSALVLFIVCAGITVAEESEFFVKTVPINRVYQHRLGYRIAYTKSDYTFGFLYVPHQWFVREAGTENEPRAELVLGSEEEYPYFSIFWRNGEFHHIRLYLKEDLRHNSYADLDNPEAMTDRFDIETLDPEF